MFRRAQDRIRMYYYKTKEELLKTKDIAIPQNQLQTLILDLHNRLKMNKFHGYYFDRACVGNENMKSICDVEGTFTCQGRWDKDKCLYHSAHSINPYISREARIIFQTWNLDHNKERSRSIIPAIRVALRASCGNNDDCVCSDNDCDRKIENGKVCRSLKGHIVPVNGRNVVINGQNIGALIARNVVIDQNVASDEKIIEDVNKRIDIKSIYDDLFTTSNLKLVHIVCHDKGAHGTRTAGPYLL